MGLHGSPTCVLTFDRAEGAGKGHMVGIVERCDHVRKLGDLGIEGDYTLPAPLDRDIRELSPDEVQSRGIAMLPSSLGEAIAAFEQSDLMRSALGDHIARSLVTNKREEWSQYRREVSGYELRRYLGTL